MSHKASSTMLQRSVLRYVRQLHPYSEMKAATASLHAPEPTLQISRPTERVDSIVQISLLPASAKTSSVSIDAPMYLEIRPGGTHTAALEPVPPTALTTQQQI